MIMVIYVFNDNKVLILGMARSGFDAALILLKRGNRVLISDSKAESEFDSDKILRLKNAGCLFNFGNQNANILDDSFDYVIKSPGIREDNSVVARAHVMKIPVINEVELAYRLLPKNVSIIAITGTNGKTTTTTLTYEILHAYYKDRVHLAGNIGYPLCGILNDIKENDILVMEISCQQSVNLFEFHPHIALMTNLSEAHIDFFGSYEKYKETKAKMFYNETSDDIAIMNADNIDVMKTLDKIKAQKLYFSNTSLTDGYLKDDGLYYKGEKIMDDSVIKIPGKHNRENILASSMIAKLMGVSNEVICDVVGSFRGVRHRLEYINTKNGVMYYNDTEATNIKCTQIALSSFKKPIIVILGGLERGQDFYELQNYMGNVKAILAIGECRQRVVEFGNSQKIPTFAYEKLHDAFSKIKDISSSGDVVLLSPASASWDQYHECEERGDEFRKLVNNLK